MRRRYMFSARMAVLLEPADQAFQDVAFAVSAPADPVCLGRDLELRDTRGVVAAVHLVTVRLAGIGAAGQLRVCTATRAARTSRFHGSSGRQGFEGSLVAALDGGQDEGDGPSIMFEAQVELVGIELSGERSSPWLACLFGEGNVTLGTDA